jgi:outer membrane protein assembly factor BamB
MRARLAISGAFFAVALPLHGADWPQFRGPNRTGISTETGLLKQWPKEGPKLLWKVDNLGNGYSTPSIAGGRVYLMSNRGDDEFAITLDAKDGKQLQSLLIGKVGNKDQKPPYPGARSTPSVDGDALYCLGSDGDLVCLDRAAGTVRWRKSLRADFGGQPGIWAYAESPLIDSDVLVCTPGGAQATLVALNKKTGNTIWQSAVPGGDQAAYASVIIGQVGNSEEYIQFLQNGVVGVDANTGKFLWRYPKTASGSPANIPTPVFHDGYVFSSTGRGGAGLVKLIPEDGGIAVKEVYASKELANPLGGVVLLDKYLYGTNGQALFCAEFMTGKVMWQDRSVGKGQICAADGRLYVRGEKGDVALVVATPEGYKETGRFSLPPVSDKPAWPYPVVANGCLYLRDQGLLCCYDVKER